MNVSTFTKKSMLTTLGKLLLVFALLLVTNFNQIAYAQTTSDTQPESQQMEQKVYLPIISSAVGASTPAVTPTPAATSTPLPPLTLTPGPVTSPQPNPDESVVYPSNGQCPSGTHLVHASDGMGVFQASDESLDDSQIEVINDNDYRCVPDQTLDAIFCGTYGQATLVGGVAACSCEMGYAGASCNVCAAGHSLDAASGQCKASETAPTALVRGSDASPEAGNSTIFTATSPAGNLIDATWTMVQPAGVNRASVEASFAERGCLFALGGDQSCKETVNGTQVGFRAPVSLTTGANVQTVHIEMRPAGGLAFTSKSVVITNKNGIPITGVGDPRMEPVLDAMSAFMKQRCVGAGMVGVSRYGVPLAVYGFGRMDGRASDDWNAYCGDDMNAALAATVTNNTPMRVGSANKGISFGVLRWTLSERLKALDSDLALTMIAPYRAVAISRAAFNTLRVSVWLISDEGNLVQLHSFDVQVAAKDFDLITLDATRVAAVIRTNANYLQLRSLNISDIGQVSEGSTFTVNEPDQKIVALSAVRVLTLGNSNPRFAIASRQNDGELNLRVVEVAGDGTFSVIGGFQTSTAARDLALVDVSTLLQRRIVVATRADDNSLKLRSFNIAANGQLSAINEISAGAIQELALTALSSSRIVAGVRTQSGNLKLIVFDVANDGELTRRGDDEAGAITDLRLTYLSDRMLAAAVRQNNGALKLITWSVAVDGTLSRAGEGEAGAIKSLDLLRLSAARMLVGVRTQEDSFKPIVWDVPSAVTLQRKGDGDGGALRDYGWTDDDVESLYLLGYDFPERMLPAKLLNVLTGSEPLPVTPIADSTTFGALEGGHPLCTDLTNKADSQWLVVQIMHLLSHRTGMQRSAPDLNYQLGRLAELRGLTSQADFVAQEAKLRAEYGNLTVQQGKDRLFYSDEETENVYVMSRPTLDEVMMLVAARCLRYPLGEEHYSNTSPTLGSAIIAHVRAPFAAHLGYPEQHEGSALDQFFAQELGIETSANSGIFAAQRVLLPGSYLQREPTGRKWSGTTYYPQEWDSKRPHCVWNESACSFSDWLNNPTQVGRLHWQWFVSPIHFVQASSDVAWGVSGGLAIEPGVYLRYMNERWISGYDDDPMSGTKRNNTWDVSLTHNGSAGGAYAYAIHYGGDNASEIAVPYDPTQGYMSDEPTFDPYMAASAAYYVANPVNGEITRYYNNLVNKTIDLNYTYGNAFDTGNSSLYPAATSLFVARHDSGQVETYSPESVAFNNVFQANYAAGDGFAVADLLTTDVYDEVLIGDTSSGEVRAYNSQGFLLKTLSVGFAAGDQLGVGDYDGDGSNELFIAKVATGAVQVYDTNGALKKTFNTGFAPGSGFAVGDVIGTARSADVIVANPINGSVSIYTYNSTTSAYALYTSFYSAYAAGTPIAVSDPVSTTSGQELLVTNLYNNVMRWDAQKNSDGNYQFYYQGLLPIAFATGADLAAGHGWGKRIYSCALEDGTRQNLPDGIDLIVSVNQGNDKQCTAVGGCSDYYSQLPNALKYGLCQVDWTQVVATPPLTQ